LAKDPPGPEWRWLREPGIFCDAYTLDIWKDSQIVRIAFGEYTERGVSPFYRVGIAMPLSDAKLFLRALTRAIKEAEEGVPEAQAE
jgi:hypothetical protein